LDSSQVSRAASATQAKAINNREKAKPKPCTTYLLGK
jgi:hypothetical protein